MKIAIGCDHGGYLLKQDILIWLEEHDIDFEDVGCFSTESVDYPIYGEKVARLVASGACEKGIVICTTGIGISIAVTTMPTCWPWVRASPAPTWPSVLWRCF